MKIDDLLRGVVTDLVIDDSYQIPSSYYENTEIISLEPVRVTGNLKRIDDTIMLEADVLGTMVIPDSVSLESVKYSFSFKLEEDVQEKVKNNENTLAIIDILWENIVLEIPIRYSEVNDYSNFSGDGWCLVDESSYQKPMVDNPFKELLEEFGEEE